MSEKPPYRVPLMSEIARIKPNGLRVISTFAGGGGSSLGYRMAGFKVLWASEFIDAARDVYQANAAPGTIIDGRDIREVDPLEVLRTLGLKPGELDVLDGSPPCSSFSTAGKREKGWGEVKKYSDKAQRTDDLFFEFIRFVRAIRPKVFVAENVSGLVKGTAKGYFLEILSAMKACGYNVKAQLLDAQWLGVPQQRQRIIFVGVRDDLGIEPVHPKPLPYRYSVRDALPGLAGKVTTKRTERSLDEPLSSVLADGARANDCQFMIERETDISGQAIGREWDKLNPGEQSEKYFSLVRADAAEPSPTVTAAGGMNSGIACVTHPTEKRKFSIAELKRICAFPDDAVLTGTYAQQWERLGRAVPPVMMMYIAKEIRDKILLPLQERERCAGLQPSGSGQRSKKGSRKIAGRGEDPRPGAVMDTSGSGMSAGSSRRTSSRSKRSLAGA
jgi:DNA (cytosine-5)-methyltransferase 1